jgi:hypothetical protein
MFRSSQSNSGAFSQRTTTFTFSSSPLARTSRHSLHANGLKPLCANELKLLCNQCHCLECSAIDLSSLVTHPHTLVNAAAASCLAIDLHGVCMVYVGFSRWWHLVA